MPMAQALAPHLPYLRRYARALTGAQESGDAYVRAALTALHPASRRWPRRLPPGWRCFGCSRRSGRAGRRQPGGPAGRQ